jgi:hypothetical protein
MQEPNPSQPQHTQAPPAQDPARQEGALAASMPEALLGTGTFLSIGFHSWTWAKRFEETLTGNGLTDDSTRRESQKYYDVVVLCRLLHGAARGTAAGGAQRQPGVEAVVNGPITTIDLLPILFDSMGFERLFPYLQTSRNIVAGSFRSTCSPSVALPQPSTVCASQASEVAACEMNDLAFFMRRRLFQPARSGNANPYIAVLRWSVTALGVTSRKRDRSATVPRQTSYPPPTVRASAHPAHRQNLSIFAAAVPVPAACMGCNVSPCELPGSPVPNFMRCISVPEVPGTHSFRAILSCLITVSRCSTLVLLFSLYYSPSRLFV